MKLADYERLGYGNITINDLEEFKALRAEAAISAAIDGNKLLRYDRTLPPNFYHKGMCFVYAEPDPVYPPEDEEAEK